MKYKVITFVFLLLLSLLVFFLFNGYQFTNILENQVEALKHQRDSIINNNIIESKQKELNHQKIADSLIKYNEYYVKADSINRITIYNERKKLNLLTRAGRDHVRDSIFRANNISNGSR